MRRLAVRIWRSGDDKPSVGHTVNVSPGGMFIGTSRPPRSGERVRVEVVDPQKGFVVEAVVTHSHDVAPELRKIQEPGMGVRFLPPEELVGPVTRPLSPLVPEPLPISPPEVPSPERPAFSDGSLTRALTTAELGSQATSGFAMRFANRAQFVDLLRRDMQHGGLFVPTDEPAPLNSVVLLELEIPGHAAEVERLQARVVHRILPKTSQVGVPGMGVEFLDRIAVVARLRRVALALESGAG